MGVIGRAFEQLPVLEKRRRSIFEPEPGAFAPSAEFTGNADAQDRPRAPAAEPLAHEEQSQPQRESKNTLNEVDSKQREIGQREMPLPAQMKVIQSVEGHTHLAPILHEAPSHTEQPHQPLPIVHTVERHFETRHTVERHEVRTERVPFSPPTRQDLPRPAVRSVPLAHNDQPRTSPKEPQRTERVPLPSELKRKQDRAAAPIPSQRTRPSSASVAGPAAPPPIQVTIGRVELRAPQPAVAPRPQASRARAPKLGLDAYLKERNGGAQ